MRPISEGTLQASMHSESRQSLDIMPSSIHVRFITVLVVPNNWDQQLAYAKIES